MARFSPNPNTAHLIRWREWGHDAFRIAEEQDKPLMLCLTAFWCGFCQRMDEVTFSDDEIATLSNAYFIPVRVEDAQRPDIDVRYNQNGWPSIAFITPWGDHLASVNYMDAGEFGDVLVKIHTVFNQQKDELRQAAVAVQRAEEPALESTPQSRVRPSAVAEISSALMELADSVDGGYGRDHKFLHPEANDFLIDRHQATGEAKHLNHVALTLDKVRASKTYDATGSGYYRYSSKPDWDEPHREKLLADHAGLLQNFTRLYVLTDRGEYRRMAEEIIAFLDSTLSDSASGAFYGCEDIVVPPATTELGAKLGMRDVSKTFSIVDETVYVDSNAQTISSLLEASWALGMPECLDRAIKALDFLWNVCRTPDGGMCHYFDGEPRVPGLLIDQVRTGIALLDTARVTAGAGYVSKAQALGDYIRTNLANPTGGYFDIAYKGPAHLRFPLTLLPQNGIAATFFLRLADATGDKAYRQASLWALSAFTEDFVPYGVYASEYGRALAAYMSQPLLVTLEGPAGDPTLRALVRAALTRLASFRLTISPAASSGAPAMYLTRGEDRIGPIHDPDDVKLELLNAPAPADR
ncbi:MAG: DUF255 domain-containing protein [SAR202 cluster bacterium]|nr:DUF255 domain-containing protein [SAR202 cluster bacterium]MDP6300859.1 DUF255 domain-containing protein [SAR202 cluster bacterium]MDP7104614.1 DUF255 domain-containing protein [SAR202 cluster bacterium]MDP7226271.1 DUF255 domain-containing protein [SAR202 cluster bacterium]MDP7415138.1 DUF255 domain-containing protein [SAR202 cluster bacterium]